MEKTPSSDIAKIKGIHGELFDLSVQSVLYDQIGRELDKGIAQKKCEIAMMQQLETELIAKNKDLDNILERGLSDYKKTLTTRLEQEFSQIYLEGPEDLEEADEEMVLTHLRQLESGTTALEAGLHNNQTMKEMRAADRDLERFESEQQKLDEALTKLDSEKGQESNAVEERRNKVIVTLVQTWKERQLIQIRKNNIETTSQPLPNPTQNHDDPNIAKETQGNRKSLNCPKLTNEGIPTFDMIFNHLIDSSGKPSLVSYSTTSNGKDLPRKPLTRITTFCTKSYDDQLASVNQKPIETQKVAAQKKVVHVTKPANNEFLAPQVEKHIKRKLPSPKELKGKPIENVSSTTVRPPPAAAPSPAKKTRKSPRQSVPSPPSDKRKCPPKKKASPAAKKSKVADNPPAVAVVDVIPAVAAAVKAPVKPPSHKSAANPSLPGMDQEFESFCDVASLGGNSKSVADGEDANESFFGGDCGGFGATSNDGDGDNNNSNWF